MAMVSIIVPVHNAVAYIEETIRSVQAQTISDWELLLVDDASCDESLPLMQRMAAEDERIRVLVCKENIGAARARNKALAEAKGRYIAYIDADDVWLPEKLEKQLAFLNREGTGFSFSAYEFGDENAKPTGKIVHVPVRLPYKKALSRTIIFTSTTIFDTEVVDKKLLEMPVIKSEDTATWWTILKAGHVAAGLDEVLTIYRRPVTSLSSDKVEAVRRIWNLYRKVAKLNLFMSSVHMVGWAYRATLRRI